MRSALVVAGIGEALTGLAIVVAPALVSRLLLGIDLADANVPVARVGGLAIIGLGLSCWPATPLIGMRFYSAAVALYLAYLGFAGAHRGALLWPAAIVHVVLTALLFRRSEGQPSRSGSGAPGHSV